MLSISLPFKGAGREKYYLQLARTGYYADGPGKAGVWLRRGADLLGLGREVTETALRALLRGFHPKNRQPLVQNAGSSRRQGAWDLTFSAPKSVSVWWALAPENAQRQIATAHDVAVARTMEFLETHVGYTRRGKRGRKLEHAAIIVAAFRHHTSRALDPQLHTHCILLNLAVRKDGTTGAVHSIEFFQVKKLLGKIYRDYLAQELLHRFQVTLEPEKNGFHIKGVPREVCRHFSKRRAQIETKLEEKAVSGGKAAKVAALATRTKKEKVSEPPFVRWRNEGERLGWGLVQAAKLARPSKQQQHVPLKSTVKHDSAPSRIQPQQSQSPRSPSVPSLPVKRTPSYFQPAVAPPTKSILPVSSSEVFQTSSTIRKPLFTWNDVFTGFQRIRWWCEDWLNRRREKSLPATFLRPRP